MTFGYADKLAYREDLGGSLGDPELEEPKASLDAKVEQLATLIRNSKKVAAFTGAGISKAAGVPDFRGPTGIWTLQRAGLPIPKLDIEFGAAKPTITHQFLVALQQAGKLTCVISQNVDGLHTRSGIARDRLAELHGSCFVETCGRCRREYVREFELDTVGFKRTGRTCECGGRLRDNCLDWESALPDADYERAIEAAEECDLMLCLGSSLRITPACELPAQAVEAGGSGNTTYTCFCLDVQFTGRQHAAAKARLQCLVLPAGGKLAIINLQETQHDKISHLHMHAKCEDVVEHLATLLELTPLPEFRRQDTVRVTYTEELPASKASTGFLIRVSSPHSDSHVTPLLQSVVISFPDDDVEGESCTKQSMQLRRRVDRTSGSLRVRLQLQLGPDADADKRQVLLEPVFLLGLQPAAAGAAGAGTRAAKRLKTANEPQTLDFSFQTQHVQY